MVLFFQVCFENGIELFGITSAACRCVYKFEVSSNARTQSTSVLVYNRQFDTVYAEIFHRLHHAYGIDSISRRIFAARIGGHIRPADRPCAVNYIANKQGVKCIYSACRRSFKHSRYLPIYCPANLQQKTSHNRRFMQTDLGEQPGHLSNAVSVNRLLRVPPGE